jgi:hypothetical protein
MIIDFRYHVASLVAIFIALALGMLIGSTLVGQDFLENITKEQQIWIGKLEQDYLTLKEETESIKQELKAKENQLNDYHNFITKITPYLVDGKLKGKNFAIIELEESSLSPNVVKILERSGAFIASNTKINFSDGLISNYSVNELIKHTVDLILNGKKSDITEFMEGKDIIKSIGNYGDPLDGIILITGTSQQKKINDTQNFINNYLKDKINLYIINNEEKIDTIPGQVDFIISLFENLNKNILLEY